MRSDGGEIDGGDGVGPLDLPPRNSQRLALLGIAVLYLLGIPYLHGFIGTQLSYFPQGLMWGGESGLANDWYSNTQPAHLAFSGLVAVLRSLDVVQLGCDLGFHLLSLLLLAGVYLQALAFCDCFARARPRELPFERHDFALWALLIVVGAHHLRLSVFFAFLHPLRTSFAYQPLPLFFDPSSFACLIYLALALLPFGRYRAVALALGIAAVFQASYLVHCVAIVSVVAAWLLWNGRRAELRTLLLPFATLAVPALAYAVWMRTGPQAGQAFAMLAETRIAHHVYPHLFWGGIRNWGLAALLVAAVVPLAWRVRGALSWVYAVSTAYVLLGILFVYWTRDASVGLLFPWRASVYLGLFAPATLIISALFLLWSSAADRLGESWEVIRRPVGVVVALFVVAGTGLLAEHRIDDRDFRFDYVEFAKRARSVTTPEDEILIPTDWMAFRLIAMRPVYVDSKSHPYRAAELLEWRRRIDAADAFFALPPAQRGAACSALGVTAWAEEAVATRVRDDRTLLHHDGFRLLRCEARAQG